MAHQLKATGDTKVLNTTVDHACLLLMLEKHSQVAAILEGPCIDSVVSDLKNQVGTLAQQVAVLSSVKPQPSSVRQQRSMMHCFSVGAWAT